MSRLLRGGLAAGLLAALPVAAPAEPPSPFELVRGLRAAGHGELALEYFDALQGATLPSDVRAALPLERAKTRLAIADDETDDGRREALVAAAAADLRAFAAAAPTHPRAAEARGDLARVTALTARARLGRALKLEEPAQRKAAAKAARPEFVKAAAEFGKAADQLESQLADAGPDRKDALTREVIQAKLDQATAALEVMRTYVDPAVAEIVERGDAVKKARGLFEKVAADYPKSPQAWVAKAWQGQCELDLDTRPAAEKLFDEVKRNATPVAAAGRRMVRYFEARQRYADALNNSAPQVMSAARSAAAEWLRDYGAGRPTPESTAMLFYAANLRRREAMKSVKVDEKTKQPVVPPQAVALLRDSERDFRRIAESEGDFARPAATLRTEVIRLIVGDAERDPQTIKQFDEAVMAAAVQFDKALKSGMTAGEARKEQYDKVVALLERAVALPAPRDAARELVDTRVRLAFAYLLAGRPYPAAVLGESLARGSRSAATAARAGVYSIQAYLGAAKLAPAGDNAAARADQERAVGVGDYLDRTFPADPNTDTARLITGQLLAQSGRAKEAFDLLGRVNPSFARAASARLLQASVGFELIRPGADGKPPANRGELYKRLVADIRAVPPAPADAAAEDAELSARLLLMLAQVHLTDAPAGFPLAEKQAAEAAARIAASTQLPDKEAFAFQAEELRARAVYAQAVPTFRAGKFADALARLAPLTGAVAKGGAAAKANQEPAVAAAAKRLDDFRREYVLVMALQAQIRLKELAKAGETFDLLKRLGGSLDSNVQALSQLIASVRPQIAALQQEGKGDDAQALSDGVVNILDKVAAEPKLSARVAVFLGRSLRELESFDRAAEVLAKVPAPPAELLMKRPADIEKDDERLATLLYRGAQLELARVHRLAGRLDAADEVLKGAMEGERAYGKSAPDFRKEAVYLLEARGAAEADPAKATPHWAAAIKKWTEIATEYNGILRRPLPALPPVPAEGAPDDARKKYDDAQRAADDLKRTKETVVKPLYFDAFAELQRCLARGNTQLLREKPDRLEVTLGKVAANIQQVEATNPDLTAEVKAKFAELIAENEKLRALYTQKGGKAFLPAAEPEAPEAP